LNFHVDTACMYNSARAVHLSWREALA